MHTKLFQIFYPRNNNSTTEWYRGKNGPCSYTFTSYSRSCIIFNLVSQQKPAQVIPLTYIPYSICFYIALGLHFLTKMYGINNLLFCCARHEFGNRSTDVSRLINLWP